MRPIKVEFQAFGPYANKEVVDFEAISKQGLFLICGKTGVGKTMILDAMTFALYGMSSGNGRNDFESMRCTTADFNTNTFVKFIFENNGEVYCFERRLVRKRINLSPEYNLMRKNADGAWVVLLENAKEKELNEKAVEIIGLDYNQFRQVIVLPQGQFEKLLTSKSSEKESILSTIFGEDKWKSIAEIVYQKAEAQKRGVTEKRENIKRSLKEDGFENLPELQTDIENRQRQLAVLEEEFNKTDYNKIIKEQQGELVIANRFVDLHKADQHVRELEAKKDERAGWSRQVSDAERAEAIRSLLADYDAADQAYQTRSRNLETAQKNEALKKGEEEKASKRLNEHIAKEPEIDKMKTNKAHYESESVTKAYEGLADKDKELKAKRQQAVITESEANKASEDYNNATQTITTLQNEYTALENEHKDLLHRYLAGITGELASQLVEGMPCPVCGSPTHPAKACLAENSINKNTVDAKKKESDKKYQELTKAITAQQEQKVLLDEKNKELEGIRAEIVGLDTKIQEMRKNLIPGIDTLTALNNAIRKLDDAITEYNADKTKYQKAAQTARDGFTEAKSGVSSAEQELKSSQTAFEASQKELKAGLEKHGFESEEEAKECMLSEEDRKDLRDKISAFDAEVETAGKTLKSIQKELAGKDEPDKKACEQKINDAINAKTDFAKDQEVKKTEIARLTEKCRKLTADSAGLEQAEVQAEEDYKFAKKLRGDTGISLQRYVLGIMFSSVVAAANRMLEMVHGGRYRLFRSDDSTQGNKAGLELKVFDKNSADHEGRFAATLSGGEKFLTSLALSIGLSTVAQKSGIKIEALFIDEGFGSLDEDSIADAMNVLDSIQKANGMVGIISHVQILQERIPTKLKVEDGPDGRHIVQSIG